MEITKVIKKPLVTEKGTRLKEKKGVYIFAVDKNANKNLIKQAVEKNFNVKVSKVATLIMHGKTRRVRLMTGERSDWKKAYVTLKQGQKIEELEA